MKVGGRDIHTQSLLQSHLTCILTDISTYIYKLMLLKIVDLEKKRHHKPNTLTYNLCKYNKQINKPCLRTENVEFITINEVQRRKKV